MSEESRLSVSSIRRFPVEIRKELNNFLNRASWQALSREFSVDLFTGLRAQALDDIADLVDSEYPEFKADVEKRLKILKNTTRGKAQSFRGKSKVGFHSYFYRFWLVGQHNADGLYDIVFCHICRKEEFDFYLCVKKIVKGGLHTLASAEQAALALKMPQVVIAYLIKGIFEDDDDKVEPAGPGGSPYTDLTQGLGDRLTEYELVEDLIERGTLEENADGTLSIRLQ